MVIETEAEFLRGGTDLYIQYASVETQGWENLPNDSRMEICITDSNGQFGKPLPINKKSFKESFFQVADEIFQRKVRVIIDQKSNTAELTVLDQSDQETSKKFNISLKNLSQNYQPFSGD